LFLFLEVESSWTLILEGWKFLLLEVEGSWFMFWDVYLHILTKNSAKKIPFSLRVDLQNVIYNDEGFVKGVFILQ
jgi:hypothetical protein